VLIGRKQDALFSELLSVGILPRAVLRKLLGNLQIPADASRLSTHSGFVVRRSRRTVAMACAVQFERIYNDLHKQAYTVRGPYQNSRGVGSFKGTGK